MKESAMPETPTAYPPAPPRPAAETPRAPTRADNRRIRDALDADFDDIEGRYWRDGSDQKTAEKLRVPRAWVTRIRELYGDDRNEADERASAEAVVLAERAAALEATALDLATKAETLGRDVRRFLDGKG